MAARTDIPLTRLPRNGGGVDNIAFTAGDAANGMQFDNDGKVILLVLNADNAQHTVTVESVKDRTGRVDNKLVTIAAAAGALSGASSYGPFKPGLFNQAGGTKVFLDLSSANLKLAAVRFED